MPTKPQADSRDCGHCGNWNSYYRSLYRSELHTEAHTFRRRLALCCGRGAPRRRCRATGLGQRRSLAKTRCKSVERRANAEATNSERPYFTAKLSSTAAWQVANTLPATLLLLVRLDRGPGRTAAARDRSYARAGGSAGASAPAAEHGKAGEGEVALRPPTVF